ncbi:MAG: hypothetical protein KDI30_10680 [Pseudomonadales bacterium]|nr:hypothetical protein [Pseudomonadales bacterium]
MDVLPWLAGLLVLIGWAAFWFMDMRDARRRGENPEKANMQGLMTWTAFGLIPATFVKWFVGVWIADGFWVAAFMTIAVAYLLNLVFAMLQA